jgi:UDP-N-acetylglucosamine--dolichyl-phosphate N-acetylglucosaminephosphotransferase
MAVTSNAVNMMDPFNGVMSGSCSIITLTLLVCALLLGLSDAALLCTSLLGVLLAFYYFNRYPSKIFSGDVGSLSVGAALGAIAILGRLEVVAVVAFMPQIMNAFYGLSTIGHLYERREVARPTRLMEDGRMRARADPRAPITLARFILARGPLKENEAALVFMVLSVIAGGLALVTAYMMLVFT